MTDDGYIKDGLVFAMVGGLLVDVAKNNTITNNGATLTADHNGRANRGFDLSPTKRIEMATAISALSIANPFTVVISIKSNLTAGNLYWLVNYISLTNKFSIYQTGNSFRIGISDNVTSYRKSRILDSNWHVLAITWDLTTLNVDMDGGTIWGGADGVNYPAIYPFAYYGDGSSDMLKIYNRVLTESEIKKLYNYWLSH